MIRQPARFAALHAEEIDLVRRVRVAPRRERDELAVGRPSRARFAAIAERQLHLAGAVGVDAIDVSDAAVLFPVGLVDREQDLSAVRRQLRIADRLLLEGVDERAAAL